MRVLIVAVGSRGDVQPLVALGIGLRASGHSVRFATHANFEAFVRSRGLDFYPVEGDPRAVLRTEVRQDTQGTGGRNIPRRLIEAAEPRVRSLLTDRHGVEAVVFSFLGLFAGYHVAEELGVPFFPALFAPLHPSRSLSSYSFPEIPGWLPLSRAYNLMAQILEGQTVWQIIYRRAINEARREVLELPPVSIENPLRQLIKRRHPCLYGFSPNILPRPPDWGDHLHVTGHWFLDRPPDWRPPHGLADFLDSGLPPVYVGFGSMYNNNPEEVTGLVLKGLAHSGQRGILVTGWGGLSNADLPDEVFKVEEIPHDWLFPHTAATVHHGGAGTTAASLRTGVPSIIVPFFADQYFWGRQVRSLGAGPKPIPRKKLSAERLSEAIRIATSDKDMRRHAASLGERIRAENGVTEAVEAFSLLAEDHKNTG